MASNKLPFERPLNEAIQIYLKRSLILGIVVSVNILGLILCFLAVSVPHLFKVLLIIVLTTYISSAKVRQETKHFLHNIYRKISNYTSIKNTNDNSGLSLENKLSVEEMVSLLKEDVAEWNNWKEQNRSLKTNLKGVDLSEANLRRANLRGVDLSEANLRKADLRGADLGKAVLIKTDFRQADLSNVNLKRVNLRGANLSDANLHKADLIGAKLRDTIFKKAILSEANLKKTFLLRADLSEVYLTRANLSKSDLSGAFFIKFFLIWGNLLGVSSNILYLLFIFIFRNEFKILSENFIFDNPILITIYSFTYFLLANIIGISILVIRPSGCLLFAVNVFGCILFFLSLFNNNYLAAIIMGFIAIAVNLREFKFLRANLSKAKLSGTNLSETNLIGANVRQARFSYNLGLSDRDKNDLRSRGAIVDEPPNGDVKDFRKLPVKA